MQAHIVLVHPESKSFNGRLANISSSKLEAAGWEVTYYDLYANNFDPREGPVNYQKQSNSEQFHAQTEQRFHAGNDTTPDDVATERDKLLRADLLIVHFPLWWFGMRLFLINQIHHGIDSHCMSGTTRNHRAHKNTLQQSGRFSKSLTSYSNLKP